MRRAWLIALLLLPACATGRRGEDFVGRDRNAEDALRCAMGEAGRLGYRLTGLPGGTTTMGTGQFRAERWLGPRETGTRSLAVLTVWARQSTVEGTRLRVDADRYEETGSRGGSGTGLGGPGGPGIAPRPGPASVDSVLRGVSRRQPGLKRVSPGPAGMDAAQIKSACSAARAEMARDS